MLLGQACVPALVPLGWSELCDVTQPQKIMMDTVDKMIGVEAMDDVGRL